MNCWHNTTIQNTTLQRYAASDSLPFPNGFTKTHCQISEPLFVCPNVFPAPLIIFWGDFMIYCTFSFVNTVLSYSVSPLYHSRYSLGKSPYFCQILANNLRHLLPIFVTSFLYPFPILLYHIFPINKIGKVKFFFTFLSAIPAQPKAAVQHKLAAAFGKLVQKILFLLLCFDLNYSPMPLTGLAPAAQSSARAAFATAYLTEHHFSSIVRGSHEKRTAFCGSFTLLFNIHNLPPDRACACGAKLSAFAPSTNVISPQLLRAAEPELFTSSNVRVCASRVPLKLSTILSS